MMQEQTVDEGSKTVCGGVHGIAATEVAAGGVVETDFQQSLCDP